MPKQKSSLNISYDPIPGTDSVDSSSRGRESLSSSNPRQPLLNRATRKTISVVIGLFILIGVVFSFFMSQRDAYFRSVIGERERSSVGVYQTSKNYFATDRLTDMTPESFENRGLNLPLNEFVFMSDSPCSKINSIEDLVVQGESCVDSLTDDVPRAFLSVNSSNTYQKILGFGGAFTEAAAHNYYKLSQDARRRVMEAYFGDEGIAYTLGRIHINSCDFSKYSYNFDNVTNDFKMEHFDISVGHDRKEIIPFIQEAQKTSVFPIHLVASPWSPPGWMKVVPDSESEDDVNRSITASMTGSNTPNGLIASNEVMSAWARYISLFLDAYQKVGIKVWAITPQNEPEFAAPWEACAYNSTFERSFIDGYLGPQMRKDHPEIKILAFDHNKDHLVNWTKAMISTKSNQTAMSEFVDGMAFHWYAGTGDRLLDGTYGYDAVEESYLLMKEFSLPMHGINHTDAAKDKILLATEGCSCPGVKLDDWLRAERLGHDILFDLASFAQGWIDWNLLLDSNGGFNHLGNNCDAPAIASENFSHVHFQPEFYYIGHFSKFIPPQSVRVESSIVGNFNYQTSVHPDVHEGIELGVFPCERSSRQMWKWRASSQDDQIGYLQLLVSAGADNSKASLDSDSSSEKVSQKRRLRHEGNEAAERYRCVGKGDDNRRFLRIWDCFPDAMDTKRSKNDENNLDENILRSRRLGLRMKEFKNHITEKNVYRLVEESADGSDMCISLDSKVQHSAGELLVMKPCVAIDTKADSALSDEKLVNQLWKWQESTGEIYPYLSILQSTKKRDQNYQHPSCITAGWPFLNALSFTTPSDQTVLTIMNEYPADTYVLIKDEIKGNMWSAMNGKSIQTITY